MGDALRGMRMPSSEYYHRQADTCVRMALSASSQRERVRLMEFANNYRDRASRAEASGGDAAQIESSSLPTNTSKGAMRGVLPREAQGLGRHFSRRTYGRQSVRAAAST